MIAVKRAHMRELSLNILERNASDRASFLDEALPGWCPVLSRPGAADETHLMHIRLRITAQSKFSPFLPKAS